MKTAISLPDPLFAEAEKVAHELGVTRSELYARALTRFLESRRGETVRAALDRVYAKHPSKIDPVLARMQAASTPDEEW